MAQFKYGNRHFEPLSTPAPKDFFTASRCCCSVGIGDYPWSAERYNYREFYRAAATAGGSKADLFFCVEDKRVYLPCEHELMLYIPFPGLK